MFPKFYSLLWRTLPAMLKIDCVRVSEPHTISSPGKAASVRSNEWRKISRKCLQICKCVKKPPGFHRGGRTLALHRSDWVTHITV